MNDKEYKKIIDTLTPLLTVGTKFRYVYLHDNYLYHVLGIFDDDAVAVKYYGKYKQWWHYEFQNMYRIWIAYNDEQGLKFVR